jgi:hypothetical protein
LLIGAVLIAWILYEFTIFSARMLLQPILIGVGALMVVIPLPLGLTAGGTTLRMAEDLSRWVGDRALAERETRERCRSLGVRDKWTLQQASRPSFVGFRRWMAHKRSPTSGASALLLLRGTFSGDGSRERPDPTQ